MKKILKGSLFLLAGVMLLAGSGVFAQVTSTQVAPSGTAIGIKPFDPIAEDSADIVQLNNLEIQSVSGTTFPAFISASSGSDIQCLKFQSSASSRGDRIACPLMPSVLYQIRVDTDTLLFLRARARASLSDFQPGDHINVYGFMNPGTGNVDALIVRDLDKPVKEIPIQLNNVRVVGLPSADSLPTTIVVARENFSSCRGFENSEKGIVMPCPAGLDFAPSMMSASGTGMSSASTTTPAFPVPMPIAQRYTVQINPGTQIMDMSRRQISVSSISFGDKLNIYGAQGKGGLIVAKIIRDLSKPVSASLGSLRIELSDGNIRCITAPCGIIYSGKVSLSDFTGKIVATDTTAKGYAYFETVATGAYAVRIEAEGYKPAASKVSIEAGRESSLSLQLYPAPIISTSTISISSLSPTSGLVGTQVTITGSGFSEKGNRINFGYGVVPNLSSSDGRTLTFTVPTSLDPLCRFSIPFCAIMSKLTTPGTYPVAVTNANGMSSAAINFTVLEGATSTPALPVINSISPAQGPVGTEVTLTGSNFLPGSSVNIGSGQVDAKISTDGHVIVFTVPQMVLRTAGCTDKFSNCTQFSDTLEPGPFVVTVANANGTSNTVYFTVMVLATTNDTLGPRR